MADLDTLMRQSLERLAEPGDPTGVAQAIRARVDAAGGPGPSGGSGGSGGLRGWWPWAGLALVAALAGGALGLGGALGAPGSPLPGMVADAVDGLACPGGSTVEGLQRGDRVLAVERSADGAWVAVRDPYLLSRELWLPVGVVVVDDGQPSVDTLDVGGCPVVSAEPSPAPSATTPAPKPTHTSKPKPTSTPDTTKPSISATSWSPGTIVGTNGPHPGESCTPDDYQATLTVTATDNVGVKKVTTSANFGDATVTQTGRSGSTYTFTIVADYNNGAAGTTQVTVTFTAHDAAGNKRSVSKAVTVTSNGGCIF
jgi:hypothetical protein